MLTIANQDYLNQKESIAYLGKRGIHFKAASTFSRLCKLYNIRGCLINGQGRARFFKPQDLDRIPPMPEV